MTTATSSLDRTGAILDKVEQGLRINEDEALHLLEHATLPDLAVAATLVRNQR